LPELITGGLAIAITAIGRALGVRPIGRIRAIKNALFDVGALMIDLEECEADNRAYKEALARRRAVDEMRQQEASYGAFPSGATTGPDAPSPRPARRGRRTRSSSRPSGRTKPGPSPTDPTRP
jgi:hypothetical protein